MLSIYNYQIKSVISPIKRDLVTFEKTKNFTILIISGHGASTEVSWNDKEVVAIDKNENAPNSRKISLHFQLARFESYLAGRDINLSHKKSSNVQ